jgi:hypothetical protein
MHTAEAGSTYFMMQKLRKKCALADLGLMHGEIARHLGRPRFYVPKQVSDCTIKASVCGCVMSCAVYQLPHIELRSIALYVNMICIQDTGGGDDGNEDGGEGRNDPEKEADEETEKVGLTVKGRWVTCCNGRGRVDTVLPMYVRACTAGQQPELKRCFALLGG